MRLYFLSAVLLAAASLAVAPAVAAELKPAAKRVYRVDTVIATAKGKGRVHTVVIQAKGAVESGGWRNARLHLLKNDGHTLTLEFLAEPPPPDMTVIEALVPLSAQTAIRTRHAIAAVQVEAAANTVTAQILH